MNFQPGNRVGIKMLATNTVAGGPYTIRRRPTNPHNQLMWELEDPHHQVTVSQNHLFPWKNGLVRGDPIPKPKTLANTIQNKAKNQALRNVLESK